MNIYLQMAQQSLTPDQAKQFNRQLLQTQQTQERRYYGLAGSSIMQGFDPEFLPVKYKFKTAVHSTTIKELHSEGKIQRITQTHPKIHYAIIMAGGNDLDSTDHTEEHMRDVLYAFIKTATTLHQNGIQTYILPILPRPTPKNTSAYAYEQQRYFMNDSIRTKLTRKLHYNPLIDLGDTLFEHEQDGIHLTHTDYYMIAECIDKHIRNTEATPRISTQKLIQELERKDKNNNRGNTQQDTQENTTGNNMQQRTDTQDGETPMVRIKHNT